MAIQIPYYSNLNPKKKQYVHMVVGGVAAVTVVMFVSGFVGGPAKVGSAASKEMPKPKPLGSVPGQQLDARDTWVGGAAKDVTRMREDVKDLANKQSRDVERQERVNAEILASLAKLTGAPPPKTAGERPAEERTAAPGQDAGATAAPTPARQPLPTPGSTAQPGTSPASLTGQPRTARLPRGDVSYPPGQPNQLQGQPAAPAAPFMGAGLVRVSASQQQPGISAGTGQAQASGQGSGAGAGNAGANTAPNMRSLNTYLPVGYIKAVILGGLLAPTGGQAQNNPIPVLLRLADTAILPNGFRGMVKDCFVIGEGYGDQSAERAYIRTTVLSCVMNDAEKTVIEVPLKGSIFGEDGMNGVRGRLITKQDQILTNALLSGIASGLGAGLAQSTQVNATTPLGVTSTNPSDTSGILKQGVGTGVSKALDRLSQYYINLAEKLFPVVEVLPSRVVDVVVTQGVQLDLTMYNGKVIGNPTSNRNTSQQRTLLRSVSTDSGEDE